MQFSNLLISPLIIAPLRYYFSTYTDSTNLVWNEDEKKATLEIGDTFDYNKIAFGVKPRILVDRGSYQISKVGLSDNLAEAKTLSETQGLKDRTSMLLYQGTAQITVEARSKGTCELLADMASHFVAWTRPELCDSQGWKEFGLPMVVSPCTPASGEEADNPKFQITIQLPWMREEHWRTRNDGITLKAVLQTITVQNQNT